MWTPKKLVNPNRQSGYDHVGYKPPGPKPFQADKYGPRDQSRNGRQWTGPRRATALEAAQDFCDYMNGLGIAVQVHSGRSGRPDFFMKDGVLHMDLPAEPGTLTLTKSPAKRPQARERELMLRMEPRLRGLMKDHDLGEAKAGISRQQIVTGVGQLRLKRYENGKGRMFLVLPSRPDAKVCAWIKAENITLITEVT